MIVERVKASLLRARSQGKRLGRRPVSKDVVKRIAGGVPEKFRVIRANGLQPDNTSFQSNGDGDVQRRSGNVHIDIFLLVSIILHRAPVWGISTTTLICRMKSVD